MVGLGFVLSFTRIN